MLTVYVQSPLMELGPRNMGVPKDDHVRMLNRNDLRGSRVDSWGEAANVTATKNGVLSAIETTEGQLGWAVS